MTRAARAAIEFPVEGISDGSVRLRLRADADTPAIVAACQDPEIARWTRVPDAYDEAAAAEWAAESSRQQAAGEGIHVLIVDETDDLLGSMGVQGLNRAERRCGLGYWLAPEARGRGVMTGAVRLMSDWVLETLPVDRIEIAIQQENHASRAVAERAGYTFEGVLRSHTLIKGRRRDMAVYSLLRGELRSPRESTQG